MGKRRWVDVVGLGISVALVSATAAIGSSFLVNGSSGWYAGLAKPVWTPPGWVFGPAWTVLYLLMAISCWLVWLRRGERRISPALGVFGTQLVLNGLWSALFFGLHRPDLAFAEIVVLLVLIGANVVVFGRVSRAAGVMLLPYLAWTGFAAALNFAIWRLNM